MNCINLLLEILVAIRVTSLTSLSIKLLKRINKLVCNTIKHDKNNMNLQG